MIVQVYRSKKKEGLYIYLEKSKPTESLPPELLEMVKPLESAMVLLLDKDKKLAQVDATKVIQCISEQGFYLQLPRTDKSQDYLNKIPNAKLGLNIHG